MDVEDATKDLEWIEEYIEDKLLQLLEFLNSWSLVKEFLNGCLRTLRLECLVLWMHDMIWDCYEMDQMEGFI